MGDGCSRPGFQAEFKQCFTRNVLPPSSANEDGFARGSGTPTGKINMLNFVKKTYKLDVTMKTCVPDSPSPDVVLFSIGVKCNL